MQKEEVKNPHMTVKEASIIAKESGCLVICSHCPPINKGDVANYENLIEAEEYDTYEI